MKLIYDSDTDSLYIELRNLPSIDSREMAQDIVFDFDERGEVLGIDIQHASRKLDLFDLSAENIPLKKVSGQ